MASTAVITILLYYLGLYYLSTFPLLFDQNLFMVFTGGDGAFVAHAHPFSLAINDQRFVVSTAELQARFGAVCPGHRGQLPGDRAVGQQTQGDVPLQWRPALELFIA